MTTTNTKNEKMTNDEIMASFESMINDEAILDRIINLSIRWRDEKEFEDWEDYEKSMLQVLAGFPIKFIRGTKRPFGFVADIGGVNINIFLKKKSGSAWLAGKMI